MKIKSLTQKALNTWTRHGWKIFGPIAIINIKHYCKMLFASGRIRPKKSSIDKIPGVETNHAVYLSTLGYTNECGAGGHAYEPIDEDAFFTALGNIPIDPSDFCFVDLGSGKGRALFFAAQAGFKGVIGVEFSESLHLLAKKNIEMASGLWPNINRIKIIHGDAGNYSPPKTSIVLYLYNPFDAKVMSRVLGNFKKSMATHSNDVWVMYGNPTESALFMKSSDFQHMSSIAGFSIFQRRLHE